MQYNIIYNQTVSSLVALPCVDTLNDLAFDKGWRIIESDINWNSLQQWKEEFNIEVMDALQFHLDYLVEDELTDDDISYINASIADFYTENHADKDEEEFDEFFTSDDEQLGDDE